jgi:hypothetical protein
VDTGSADSASPDTGRNLLLQETMTVLSVERDTGHFLYYILMPDINYVLI